ncbi:MAG: hypothetical protein M3539_13840 [Acidobacteriota bacterium]|nr:hypothetical protein [Acidobacteriota bacterium]
MKLVRASNLEDDLDALFRLPLAEFTGARNAIAARLKKSGRGDEAVLVKALAKPSISAWAVNQLYWNHREAFDRLIASGERFHKAQTSKGSAKVAEMRTALEARREALTHLSDLATSLLRDSGHNPSPDTIHRITTTLEAMSVYASRSDGRYPGGPGRLTHDVDPPGFESLASFVPSATKQEAGGRRQATEDRKQTAGGRRQARPLEDTRKAKIAAAKVSLQDAKRSLTEARARAQRLEAARKRADTEAKKAEKRRRDAEENLANAKAASEDAAQRARSVAVEVEEAASAVEDAERAVEAASEQMERLFREI